MMDMARADSAISLEPGTIFRVPGLELLPKNILEHSLAVGKPRPFVIKWLRAWHGILTLASEAIAKFQSGQYREFDPLGGNHSCEIVAFRLLTIIENYKSDESHQSQLEQLRSRLNYIASRTANLITEATQPSFTSFGPVSLNEYFDVNRINFFCKENSFYLILSYFLSIVKRRSSLQQIIADPIRLRERELCSSQKSADQLIKTWQQLLSRMTAKFLHLEALHLEGSQSAWAKFVRGHHLALDEFDRVCLPSFASNCILLNRFIKKDGRILIVRVNILGDEGCIHSFSLPYMVKSERLVQLKHSHIQSLRGKTDLFAWVWEGCTTGTFAVTSKEEFAQELSRWDPLQFLITDSWHYPEYPLDRAMSARNTRLHDPVALRHLCGLSEERITKIQGFSTESASIWCGTHIFVDRLRSAMRPSAETAVYLPGYVPRIPQAA